MTPCVPEGREGELIVKVVDVGVAAVIEINTVLVANRGEELESETVTVKEKLPLELGVPAMMPEPGARFRPDGRLPEAMLHV